MNKLLTSRYRYIIYSVLFLVLIISLLELFKILLIKSYFDFNYYYLTLQLYIKGNNPYLVRVFPFPYPPLAILMLLPFTFMPLLIAAKSFVVISFFCLFFSVFLLLRLFKIPIYSLQSALIIILICNYFPVKYSLAGGQINNVVLLFVVLFAYWFVKKRDMLSGITLAIAIMLKLFPPFIVPYLFFIKRYSLIKAFLISSVVISIFVLIFIPLPIITSYFVTTLPIFFHTGGGTYYFDQSLSAFMARSITSSFAIQFAKPFAFIILIATYGLLWKKKQLAKIELLGLSILLILNIILGNFAWQHHFIWFIIPYITTFVYIKSNKLSKKYYIILIASYLLTAANIEFPRLYPPIIQSHVFYGAAILYILLLHLIITKSTIISPTKNNASKSKSFPKRKAK